MTARWMKLDHNGRDVKTWSVNDVIDFGFDVTPEGTGVLQVKVKAFTEWGFAIESIPWSAKEDKLVFS